MSMEQGSALDIYMDIEVSNYSHIDNIYFDNRIFSIISKYILRFVLSLQNLFFLLFK